MQIYFATDTDHLVKFFISNYPSIITRRIARVILKHQKRQPLEIQTQTIKRKKKKKTLKQVLGIWLNFNPKF